MSNKVDSSLTRLSESQLEQVKLLEKKNANAECVQELQQRMQEMETNHERMCQQQTRALSASQSSSESCAVLIQQVIKLDAENRELRKLLSERGQGLK